MTKYKWEKAPRPNGKIDPYSRWLLRAGQTSIDLERFSKDPGNPRFLFFSRTGSDGPTEVKNTSVLAADAPDETIWKPDGADYEFKLGRYDFETLREYFLGNLTAIIPLEEAVESYVQLAPMDEDMVPKTFEPIAPKPDLKDLGIDKNKAVIVGVIDDGINISHERFFDPKGNSRVDFAWHQDGLAEKASPVMFGRELTGPQLTALSKQYDTEEEILRALGLVDPAKAEATTLSKSFSHGTFVLDRLAGYPSDEKRYTTDVHGNRRPPDENEGTNPEDRRIVSVQLHRRVTEESSGVLYTLFAMLGLQYIVDRARLVAKEIRKGAGHEGDDRKVPLVVNFSYGLAGGPHNGEHLFERFVDQMVTLLDEDTELGPLIVPMPTGNRHLLEGHAHRHAEKDGPTCLDLNWITQPQDKSPNYLEIWVPKPPESSSVQATAPDTILHLKLQPPFGGKELILTLPFDLAKPGEDQGRELIDENGNILAQVTLDTLDADNADDNKRLHPDEPDQYAKARILIALAPTYPVSDDKVHIPPGVWRVTAHTHLAPGEYLEAWIQRDDSPPLFRRPGRQSYLELTDWTPEWQRQDELTEHIHPLEPGAGVSRYGAISGIATAHNMLRVSGVRLYDDNMPALYSGAPHEGMRSVRAAAAADRSRVHRGLVGTGGLSGSTQVMNGTSVAVPIVGRLIADYLAKTPQGTAKKAIEGFLCKNRHSRQPPKANPSPAKQVLEANPDLAMRRGGPPLKIGDPEDTYECKLLNGRKWPYLRR
ncbi:hypothetical protein WNZ15_22655 [Roseibium sp. AS2]|uniref:hypothetical protein n=1 Tax=Roseibium sp. AS2 TaxID=3135781 RepID=UPI003170215A